MSKAERHISKPGLEKLLKAADSCESSIGMARAALGEKLEKAEAEDHLNKWAFRVVRQLNKMDPVKCAHNIRALYLYLDLLGLPEQTDLEDAIAGAELEPEDIPANMARIGRAVTKAH